MTRLSEERREEIGGFLRSRRERLQPEDVGLARGRRRTPGLRREEAAMRAGISAEWYTRLEQAREVRASADVLVRIGQALCLEPREINHLLELSGYAPDATAGSEGGQAGVGEHLERLLTELEPSPAWIVGTRWDILAWNRATELIFGDLSRRTGLERNNLWLLFLDERVRTMLEDWASHARAFVGLIRREYAQRMHDPWYTEIVNTLRRESRPFREWWGALEIQGYRDGGKHYHHPELGRLSFEYTSFSVVDERYKELSMITYIPIGGTATRERLLEALDCDDAGPSSPGEAERDTYPRSLS